MSIQSMLLQMLHGSIPTIGLFFVTLLLGIPFGFMLTLLYNSKNKVVHNVTGVYILLMRGTPLLLQLFFICYGMPFLPFIGKYMVFSRLTCCCIAFVLNYMAYFAEIFRGGLLAIDKGQSEAAKVLGLTKVQTFCKIIFPQMLRVSLPAISNEAIILVKDTSLVTALGVTELLQTTKNIVTVTAHIFPYAVAALFYLFMSWCLTLLFRHLEKKYSFE